MSQELISILDGINIILIKSLLPLVSNIILKRKKRQIFNPTEEFLTNSSSQAKKYTPPPPPPSIPTKLSTHFIHISYRNSLKKNYPHKFNSVDRNNARSDIRVSDKKKQKKYRITLHRLLPSAQESDQKRVMF